MNAFDSQVVDAAGIVLWSHDIGTIQVNVGLRCNQECAHCHVMSSPRRTEEMSWQTMEEILRVAETIGCRFVDITGGAPELNPHFRRFVTALRNAGRDVQVRTNLTVLLEPEMETMPEFLRTHGVRLVASLPCYLAENVARQRGDGVYEKSIKAIRRLNAIGYGTDPDLPLNLVYNPVGAHLPPDQAQLEADYRRELNENYGIVFTNLLAITNMPIGQFRADLRRLGTFDDYTGLIRDSFNPGTLDGLMCRNQISVAWDGMLYDCDFNLALRMPVDHGAPNHISRFAAEVLTTRCIVTGDHCFGCTAGCGSSCGGALG